MESNTILYLLKVIAIHGVFFALYFFFLRNRTAWILNRIYLLAALVIAFVIPLLEIPVAVETISLIDTQVLEWTETPAMQRVDMTSIPVTPQVEKRTFDLWNLVFWLYGVIALLLLLRSIFHLFILQKLKKQSIYVEKQWFKLFKTTQVHPFSFLTNVFIPASMFGTESFGQILEHECEHVRQYHSIDRLLIDFMAALFWFNPFMYLYRRALIEIHEYQADAAVIRKFPDPVRYQEVLFSQLKATPYSGLVSHFNFSTIKKRIVMINKQKKGASAWAYFLAAPVTIFVVLAFAGKMGPELVPVPLEVVDKVPVVEEPAIEAIAKPQPQPVEKTKARISVSKPVQQDFKPSILPLKETGKMKITSRFGMRVDPFDQKRKMHKGLDLGTPTGTTVVATADGVIHEAGYNDRYGYYVLIEHGDKFMTRYAQLSLHTVSRGDQVKRGQKIGLSGNSGRSTAPHLHYEVIEVGVGHKNPMNFINDDKLQSEELAPPPPPPADHEEDELVLTDELKRVIHERAIAEEAIAAAMAQQAMAQSRQELAIAERLKAVEAMTAVREQEKLANALMLQAERAEAELQRLKVMEEQRRVDEDRILVEEIQKKEKEKEKVKVKKDKKNKS